MLKEAPLRKKYVKAAQVLITSVGIDKDQKNYDAAIQKLRRSIALSNVGRMPRLLADALVDLADIYRVRGALDRAQPLMKEAARSTPWSSRLTAEVSVHQLLIPNVLSRRESSGGT